MYHTGPYPSELAFSPDSKFVYTVHEGGHIDVFDRATFLHVEEMSTVFNSILYNINEIAVDKSGRFLFAGTQGKLLVLNTGRVADSEPAETYNGDFANGSLSGWTTSGSGSVEIVDLGGNFAVQLSTGSPVSLTQALNTPTESFALTFDYQFVSGEGHVDVLMGGQIIDTLPVAVGSMTTHSIAVDDPQFFDLTSADLTFTLDSQTSAQVQLDNIDIVTVPEPSAVALGIVAIAMVCQVYVLRRRMSRTV